MLEVKRREVELERDEISAVTMPGRISGADAIRHICRIAAISPDGVRLRLFAAVGIGCRVTISLPGGSRHPGTIVWEGEGEAGCAFGEPVAASLLGELARVFACEPRERAAWSLV